MSNKLDLKEKAKAVVSVNLEISVNDVWGYGCTIDQIFSQASKSAMDYLSREIEKRSDFKIVGKPKVTAIIVEDG